MPTEDLPDVGCCFTIHGWRVWQPTGPRSADPSDGWDGHRVPSPASIAPLLRRRLSPPARVALQVAADCLADHDKNELPSVFASRDGELGRSAELLGQIHRDEPLSPAAFSLSVHNSAAGIHAIARGARAASTTVAAGTATLALGLLEAIAQSAAGAGEVLLVYVEGPAPAEYGELVTAPAPLGLALRLEVGSAPGWRLQRGPRAESGPASPGLELIELLDGRATHAVLAGPDPLWSMAPSHG